MASRSRAASRRLLLRRLIAKQPVRSQEELVDLLAANGHRVTQTTVSRDLAALDVLKRVLPEGGERYVLANSGGNGRPADPHLVRMLREFVTAIDHSGNLVVVKTAPGAAHPVASALDATPPPGVVGTVAGDDTILIVAAALPHPAQQIEKVPRVGEADPSPGRTVAQTLERLMEARPQ